MRRLLGPVNPVLQRELTERWRSSRAIVTLTVYLALLSLVLYLLYRTGTSVLAVRFGQFGGSGAMAGPLLGRFLLESLLLLVLLLVLFVAPGYAAAQLSGERERRTLPLLQATLLRPHQIVLGKLGAAVAWILVLIVAALPLGATAFFLGGVAIGDLLRGVGFIAAVGLCVAAIALGISSLTRRTTTSIVLTYAMVLALTGGTLFLSGVELVARSATGRPASTPVAMHANPFVGLADAVVSPGGLRMDMGMGGLPLPLTGIASALPNRQEVWMGQPVMDVPPGLDGPFGPGPMPEVVEEPVPAMPDAPPPPRPAPAPVPPPPLPDPAAGYFDGPAMQGPVQVPEGGLGQRGEAGPAQPPAPGRGLWLWVLGLHAGAGLGGLVVATRRLRTGRTTARLRSARRVPADHGASS